MITFTLCLVRFPRKLLSGRLIKPGASTPTFVSLIRYKDRRKSGTQRQKGWLALSPAAGPAAVCSSGQTGSSPGPHCPASSGEQTAVNPPPQSGLSSGRDILQPPCSAVGYGN